MKTKWTKYLFGFILLAMVLLAKYIMAYIQHEPETTPTPSPPSTTLLTLPNTNVTIPTYTGTPAYTVDKNPMFGDFEKTANYEYEYYSMLDELGRCGVCEAAVCAETLPTMPRGEIGNVKPSGWKQAKYDWVDGKYVYNRCHLLGYQLTAENDNPLNLITGTRYLNVDGMLPYENEVADYIRKNPDNHVFYRVTPVFVGSELVCRGVWMQAWSVEDNGALHFNIFCYNNQPGVIIDYATGETKAE